MKPYQPHPLVAAAAQTQRLTSYHVLLDHVRPTPFHDLGTLELRTHRLRLHGLIYNHRGCSHATSRSRPVWSRPLPRDDRYHRGHYHLSGAAVTEAATTSLKGCDHRVCVQLTGGAASTKAVATLPREMRPLRPSPPRQGGCDHHGCSRYASAATTRATISVFMTLTMRFFIVVGI